MFTEQKWNVLVENDGAVDVQGWPEGHPFLGKQL